MAEVKPEWLALGAKVALENGFSFHQYDVHPGVCFFFRQKGKEYFTVSVLLGAAESDDDAKRIIRNSASRLAAELKAA